MPLAAALVPASVPQQVPGTVPFRQVVGTMF